MTPSNLYVHAMKSPKATYFYAFDVERLNAGDASRELAPYQAASLDLKDIPDGEYTAEFWDPLTGDIVANSSVSVTDGNAHVVLPDFTQDIACKMRLQG